MTIVSVPPATIAADAMASSAWQMAAASPTQAPQTITEYLATVNPGSLAAGASPNQLGESIVNNLRGFLDRSHSMTSRARALADPTPPPHAAMTLAHRGPAHAALEPSGVRVGPQPPRGSVDGHQMDRVIQALGLVFDYSIETQLVVRGATQVSGSANTLLRGQ
jgi:hypothetical protein